MFTSDEATFCPYDPLIKREFMQWELLHLRDHMMLECRSDKLKNTALVFFDVG